jgi:Spy/CpxP family protein refolding chaperone
MNPKATLRLLAPILAVCAMAGVQTCGAADVAGGAQGHSQAAPYAGMQSRTVKALSDTQVADLKAGRGMGYALAAELNGYPGPLHVLELADALALTPEQRARTQSLRDAMKAETSALGEQIIAQETALDQSFARHSVTDASLKAAVMQLGEAYGALRYTHLRYHLAMADLLSEQQIARYRDLRGYTPGEGRAMHHNHSHDHGPQ